MNLSFLHSIFQKPFVRILFALFGVCVFVFLVFLTLPMNLPTIPYSLIIKDSKQQEIGEIIYEKKIRHRATKLSDVPVFFQNALLALEDKDFYSHLGVSVSGLARSTVANISALKVVQGGSTIQMQLIRNLFWLNARRTLDKKLLEMLYAIRLTLHMPREQILEKYIDSVSFGYMNYGLASAANFYFGTSPSNLSLAQQIALLAIPRDANRYNPYKNPTAFKARFQLITNALAQKWLLTATQKQSVLAERLSFLPWQERAEPYVMDYISQKTVADGYEQERITSFDLDLSKQVQEIAKGALVGLSWKNVGDYSVILIDKKTRQLKVLIGGHSWYGAAGQVNSALALRLPGSAIKPFTYALAFRDLGLTPTSRLLDIPTQFLTKEGYSYAPKNYSQSFAGEVSATEALAQSLNVPAVRLLGDLGVQKLLDFLHEVGMSSLTQNAEHYGLALTLWDGEVSLLELTSAFDIFAAGGQHCAVVFSTETSSECRQIMDAKYTNMVTDILTNGYAKLLHFPLYSALDFRGAKIFVKTGTSRNFKDNWAVGFDDKYLIGVWAGNKDGENMKGVSGATGAGEIFARIVNRNRHANQAQATPNAANIPTHQSESFVHITSPLAGSKYLKTNKTNESIGLSLQTNIESISVEWQIDGKKMEDTLFVPTIGTHTAQVTLVDKNGKTWSDTSFFEVVSGE